MLNRLGLVIHWIGLVFAITVVSLGLTNLDLVSREMAVMGMSAEGAALARDANFSEEMSDEDLEIFIANTTTEDGEIKIYIANAFTGDSDIPVWRNWLYVWPISLLWAVGAISITWAIRWTLSGHKSPLPWVANKEANNG